MVQYNYVLQQVVKSHSCHSSSSHPSISLRLDTWMSGTILWTQARLWNSVLDYHWSPHQSSIKCTQPVEYLLCSPTYLIQVLQTFHIYTINISYTLTCIPPDCVYTSRINFQRTLLHAFPAANIIQLDWIMRMDLFCAWRILSSLLSI